MPPWLLFDKKDGVFWGIPLSQNVGSIHLTVRGVSESSPAEKIVINIVEPTEEVQGIEKCQKDEDNTILTLLIDKNIRAVKPKQRVIAIINFAKFFGLPYVSITKIHHSSSVMNMIPCDYSKFFFLECLYNATSN